MWLSVMLSLFPLGFFFNDDLRNNPADFLAPVACKISLSPTPAMLHPFAHRQNWRSGYLALFRRFA